MCIKIFNVTIKRRTIECLQTGKKKGEKNRRQKRRKKRQKRKHGTGNSEQNSRDSPSTSGITINVNGLNLYNKETVILHETSKIRYLHMKHLSGIIPFLLGWVCLCVSVWCVFVGGEGVVNSVYTVFVKDFGGTEKFGGPAAKF